MTDPKEPQTTASIRLTLRLADRVDALAKAVEERFGGMRVEFNVGGSMSVKEALAGYSELLRTLPSSGGEVVAVPEGWKLVPVEPTTDMLMTQGKSRPAKRVADLIQQALAAAPAAGLYLEITVKEAKK